MKFHLSLSKKERKQLILSTKRSRSLKERGPMAKEIDSKSLKREAAAAWSLADTRITHTASTTYLQLLLLCQIRLRRLPIGPALHSDLKYFL